MGLRQPKIFILNKSKKYFPFFIGVIFSVLALTLTYFYLERACLSNPGCSGEHGIVFVILSMPWIYFFEKSVTASVYLGLILNSLCIGILFQVTSSVFFFFKTKVK